MVTRMSDTVSLILMFAQALSTLSAAGVAIALWISKAKAPSVKINSRIDKLEEDMKFVKTCLETFNIENAGELPRIIKPIDFLKLENKNIIYQGFLQNYSGI